MNTPRPRPKNAGIYSRRLLLLLAAFVAASALAPSGASGQVGAARECVISSLVWNSTNLTIPVCWETSLSERVTSTLRCTCGDGTQTAAPCPSDLCLRACATRGGASCEGQRIRVETACPPSISPSDCTAKRAAVKKAVADTWEKNSLIRFTGWMNCPLQKEFTGCNGSEGDGRQGIRIKVLTDGRSKACPGTSGDNVGASVRLTFGGRSIARVRATAVHEFGHVLGFDHEQERADNPDWCKEERFNAPGDSSCPDSELSAAWDASSVMNYCNVNWSGNGTLSAADISAVRRLYGTPVSVPCDAGLTDCSGACVNISSDVNHCGACDRPPCPADHACINGSCRSCACNGRCAPSACGRTCTCASDQECDGNQNCVSRCGNIGQQCCPGGAPCKSSGRYDERTTCFEGVCKLMSSVPCSCVNGLRRPFPGAIPASCADPQCRWLCLRGANCGSSPP